MVEYNDAIHEYTLEGIHLPSVSELLKPILSDFEYDPKYAEKGQAVHTLTELWDTGLYLPELADDELMPYMMAYEDFHDQHEVEVQEIEMMVFNPTLMYAGRLDRLWMIDGKKHLTDIKTGGKYKQHLFQLYAYHLASDGGFTNDSLELSNLYLNPFNFKLHTWTTSDLNYAHNMVEALSLIYWDKHRRDRKSLEKILEVKHGV